MTTDAQRAKARKARGRWATERIHVYPVTLPEDIYLNAKFYARSIGVELDQLIEDLLAELPDAPYIPPGLGKP